MSEKRWALKWNKEDDYGFYDDFERVTVPGPGEMIVPVQDLLTLVKASGYRPNTDEHDITSGEYVEAYSRLRALLPEEPEERPTYTCLRCGGKCVEYYDSPAGKKPPEEPVIRPCPAEGLTNSQHHPRPRTVGDGFYAIVCICGVSGPESATEKNALAWWNALPRRADTPAKGES